MNNKEQVKQEQIKRENAKDELINLLTDQITQLSIITKVELGDDVIKRIKELKKEIKKRR